MAQDNQLPVAVNTFVKGLNKDVSDMLNDPQTYRHAVNIQSYDAGEGVTGARIAVNGTEKSMRFLWGSADVIGNCVIRDYIILFMRTTNATNHDKIVVLRELKSVGGTQNQNSMTYRNVHYVNGKYTEDTGDFVNSNNVFWQGDLGFNDINYIDATSFWKSKGDARVYFCDGVHSLRTFNIFDDPTGNVESNFNIVKQESLAQPVCTGIAEDDSSTLKSGMVQYCYQLYNINGSTSVFSQPSQLVHLVKDSIPACTGVSGTANADYEYTGGDKGDSSGKIVTISIPGLTTNNYTHIRLARIFYDSINGDPIITSFNGQVIVAGTMQLTDNGVATDGITLTKLEVTQGGSLDVKPACLASKYNFLFVANLQDSLLNISDDEFDARAYRFNGTGYSDIYDKSETSNKKKIRIKGSDKSANFSSISDGSISSISNGWLGVPSTYDCLNPTNWLGEGTVNVFNINGLNYDTGYIYQSDGVTVGGEGAFVKYRFLPDQLGTVTDPLTQTYAAPDNYGTYQVDKKKEVDKALRFPIEQDGIASGSATTPNRVGTVKATTNIQLNPSSLTYMDSVNGGVVNNTGIVLDPTTPNAFYNYQSHPLLSFKRSFHRDEVYRAGIQFFDKSGRPYYVKWVGDIKIPKIPITTTESSSTHDKFNTGSSPTKSVYARPIHIEFTVNIPTSLQSKISGFRIVRVKRSQNDRSILGQGYMEPLIYSSFGSLGNTGDFSTFAFMSPESMYSKDILPSVGSSGYYLDSYYRDGGLLDTDLSGQMEDHYIADKYESTMYLGVQSIKPVDGTGYDADRTNGGILSDSFLGDFAEFVSDGLVPMTWEIVTGKKVLMSLAGYIDGKSYLNSNNRYYGFTFGIREPYVNFGLSLDKIGYAVSFPVSFSTTTAYLTFCNFKQYITNQYGGYESQSRDKNVYITSSMFISTNDSTQTYTVSAYGDTFIDMFESQIPSFYAMRNTGCVNKTFPVETSYNLSLSNFKTSYRDGNIKNFEKRVLESYLNLKDNTRIGYYGGYGKGYNTVFSKEDDLFVGIALDQELLTSIGDKTRDCRIRWSEQKTLDQDLDSWTVFKEADFIDVDTEHGQINWLESFDNKLIFAQDKAIGVLAVKERELFNQGTTADSLILGTGSVGDRYDYLSKHVGGKHVYGRAKSHNMLFFYDCINKKIMLYSGDSLNPITDVKGLSSFFMNTDNRLTDPKGNGNMLDVIAVYNRITNQCWFTFAPDKTTLANNSSSASSLASLYNETNFTVSLSSLDQSFCSFLSFVPQTYINCNNNVLSIPFKTGSGDGLDFAMFTHNVKDNDVKASIYGTKRDSSIHFVVNSAAQVTKVFDTFKFLFDHNVATDTSFIKSIRVWNSFQDSGVVPLVHTTAARNIRQIETTIQMHVPRDATNRTRMRDNFLNVEIVFNNNTRNNINYILHLIRTGFRYSIR